MMQFVRRYGVRIGMGTVLAVMAYGAISVYQGYRRDQRIAHSFKSLGAEVDFRYGGPAFVPESLQGHLWFFDRVGRMDLASFDSMPPGVLSHLANLTQLEELDLGNTNASDAECRVLRDLASLSVLHLGQTQVTDAGLVNLKGLQNLYWIELNNTELSDDGLEALRGLTGVQIFDLSNTQITDSGLLYLKGMRDLSLLSLEHTQVTDAGLEHLLGMKVLRNLHLTGTQTTVEGRNRLRKALPKCSITPSP